MTSSPVNTRAPRTASVAPAPVGKATRIEFLSIGTPQMRAFHMSWLAFFGVFFAWFGVAPLMPVIRDDLGLTRTQVGNTIVASVAVTILARMLIGPLCDRFGARLTYSGLLVLGSIPVMGIGLADSYESFLLFRLAIGAIGAAFVITQYHTSVMFAENCVGTANATTAGWGNVGGGLTQIAMPVMLAGILALGVTSGSAWRIAVAIPGVLLFVMGVAYFFLTQDSPTGNYRDLRKEGRLPDELGSPGLASFRAAASDERVWALFLAYAACFGVQLTMINVAALYFHDHFALDVKSAGLAAALFGITSIFARTLGGWVSDRAGRRWGISGRTSVLFGVLLLAGLSLVLFSLMDVLAVAIGAAILLSICLQIAQGATFGIVPFLNRSALGAVSGIVGAGGNVGAVAAGLLFRSESRSFQDSFLYMGLAVMAISFAALYVPSPSRSARGLLPRLQNRSAGVQTSPS